MTPILRGKNSVLEFITLTARSDLEYVFFYVNDSTAYNVLGVFNFGHKPLCQTE